MKFLIFRLVEWLYTDYVIVLRLGTHLRITADDGAVAALDVTMPHGHRILWMKSAGFSE